MMHQLFRKEGNEDRKVNSGKGSNGTICDLGVTTES